MDNENKSLRILQDDFNLKDIFNPEFLKKLEENFNEGDVAPVAVAFVIKKDEITKDMINLSYRNDEELENNIILIDVQNPQNMNIIRKIME